MKLKIYVIKKQQLIWAAIALAIVVIAAVLLISLRTTQTINFLNSSNTYKSDINNDGKVDSVVVDVDEKTQKYSINLICSDGNGYTLEPDPVIKSFGNCSTKWPINITFNDVNKDGNQEIFIQASDNKGPILHIFKYSTGKIERLASGRYSIYGFIKNTSNNMNMVVLGSNRQDTIQLSYLELDSDRLIPYSAPASLSLGRDTLSSFVSFIEQKDVEVSNLNIGDRIESKVLKGNFLDGIIKDAKFTNHEIPSECTYILRSNSSDEGKDQIVKYKVKLSLDQYDSTSPEYKITKIDKIK